MDLKTELDKNLSIIITESDCWEWQGNKNPAGYGRFTVKENGKSVSLLAHRASWMVHNNVDVIPKGMFICHHCDNPKCINPNHLYMGTPKDNAQDCVRRGRHRKGKKYSVMNKNLAAVKEKNALQSEIRQFNIRT